MIYENYEKTYEAYLKKVKKEEFALCLSAAVYESFIKKKKENLTIEMIMPCYDFMRALERTFHYDDYIASGYNDYYDCFNSYGCASVACKELLGVGISDLERAYPYECCKGYFEGDFNFVKYCEEYVFGKWVTTDFIQHTEKGYYEIEKEGNKDYRDYKEKHVKLTIEKICNKYPDRVYNTIRLLSCFEDEKGESCRNVLCQLSTLVYEKQNKTQMAEI